MRKNRLIEQGRCYLLISRLAHRTFLFDDEVEIMRRILVLYRDASLEQVVAIWNRLQAEVQDLTVRLEKRKKWESRRNLRICKERCRMNKAA